MNKLTPQQIMDLKPCPDYTLERVKELFADAESLTHLEILDMDVPHEDLAWLFCQPNVLGKSERDRWFEMIITRAITNHALKCGIAKVEKWAVGWLDNTDRTYTSARKAYVAAAAADVAYAAYADAAYAAYAVADADDAANVAYAAADAAAAAYAAYAADAYAAAAAADAARKGERSQQIRELRQILKENTND